MDKKLLYIFDFDKNFRLINMSGKEYVEKLEGDKSFYYDVENYLLPASFSGANTPMLRTEYEFEIKDELKHLNEGETLLNFKSNSNYKLIEDSSGDNWIESTAIKNNGVVEKIHFDPKTFEPKEVGEVRFITRGLQLKLKEELDKFYGDEDEKDETNMSEIKDLVKELNQQNMEMFKEISQNNPYEKEIVNGIIEKGKEISTDQILDDSKDKIDKYIKDTYGVLPQKIEVKTKDTSKEIQGIFHEKYETILKLVNYNIPTMLVGPAGSGKNHTLEQVAESLDLEFYFSNAITQEFKLTGFIDAGGNYHETQFYKAFKNGGVFFLDEIDASIPEVLVILNAAIANKYFDFPIGKVEAHEDFRVVAAGNTVGHGADNSYSGRQQLDAATLDRFALVNFEYDEKVEEQLSSSDELYEFIKAIRNEIVEKDFRYTISMRALINASKLEGVMDKKDIVDMVIFKGIPKDEREMIIDDLEIDNNEYLESVKGEF